MNIGKVLQDLWETSGFNNLFVHWENAAMVVIACVLLYLALVKGFEPLLLVGIAFGMLLTNLPLSGLMHMEFYQDKVVDYGRVLHEGGLLDILYLGVKLGVYPCLIFLG
ncbi:MAG: sodium ion-translocating decarboxylase subunit beta, partial [Oscillospiraceae bacterium]|nr:sodium ion-translocating decarboxylase subunit beta [Oscillospiraceae bacterium]